MTGMNVNSDRLHDRLCQLARIGRAADGAITRIAFSDADIEGRELVMELMRNADLSVGVDTVGNIFGRRDGANSSLPPILIGSHIDTVPDGGAYDGALGVLAAVEVAHSLNDHRFSTRHPVEVVAWSDEEGGLSGSRGFVGDLDIAELSATVPAGTTLGEGISKVGGDPNRISEACRSSAHVGGYLELHVEQGGRLEAGQIDIGVVTGIVGIRHFRVEFEGKPNHAGTTPMDQRQNALLAGSEFVLAVDRVVRSVEGQQVGTVGEMTVRPGAPNVIPGEVQLTVELRDLEPAKIDYLWSMLESELETCSKLHGTSFRHSVTHSIEGIETDTTVQACIVAAVEELGLSHCMMPSGAGHDAQNLARITPTGMIFVPSVDGVSHSPREYTSGRDVTQGAEALLHSLLRVDEL